MKKVALFTTFFEAESGYSLIAVAETQIRMLLDHGYDPVVLVDERFKSSKPLWQLQAIDIRPVIPAQPLRADTVQILRDNLQGVDVCLTHDIILQNTYQPLAEAVQVYAEENPALLWLHFIHSCPSGERPSPPGYIVYPNASDKPRVVWAYRLQGQEHRVIPNRASHSIDPLQVWNYDPLTRAIVSKFDLTDADISAVYPARLDRGKQPEKVIRLLAGVNQAGYRARLLVIDWQSAGAHFQRYIEELTELAAELGLEVGFTSRLDDRANQGVPRHVVTELMDLSNVYIHPSRVETYSLVVHEAILRGKLVVLNFDLPVMQELFGEAGIYMDFGSDRFERSYAPTEQRFWNDEAHRLIAEFKRNRALVAQSKARREWGPGAMWREFEGLLWLGK
ncbi:MAG TPA: glycosyltransferase [Anaerolineae bacterium]|nr:glycosyltransferase [Anaerolineae bacterium]